VTPFAVLTVIIFLSQCIVKFVKEIGMKCFVCCKEINKQDSNHVYRCAKSRNMNMTKKQLRYENICFNAGFRITKEFMEEEYCIRGKSLPDFKKDYGLIYPWTKFLLEFFGIKARTLKESCNFNRLEKYKSSCVEKYGVDNPSKSEGIKAKKAATFMRHYGVDNIRKSRKYREEAHKKMLARFGKGSVSNLHGNADSWGWRKCDKDKKSKRIRKAHEGFKRYWEALSDEEKDEYVQKRCTGIVKHFKSRLESRIQKTLNALRISYVHQKWIRRRSYDFHICRTKVLIEVQGDYWHANPNIYNAFDILTHRDIDIMACEIWKRDEEKRVLAEDYGYRVEYFGRVS